MRFLVDAQLPRRLALQLNASGHDAVHTLDCPAGNNTTDSEIVAFAIRDHRVVLTKDNDFVNSFLLQGVPPKLLLISTGNISNEALFALVAANLSALEKALEAHDFVELSATAITIHV
jgi:predicted nuclease of predicted toxin-antitoxin system